MEIIFTSGFLLVVSLTVVDSMSYDNLLINSDLEEGPFIDPQKGWFKMGCSATLSSDSYTGNGSVMVTNRQASWGGMAHIVDVEAGKKYFFVGYIKLLNSAVGTLTDNITMMMSYKNTFSGARKYVHTGYVRFTQPNIWRRIGVDFTVLSGYDKMQFYIQVESKEVNYLLDSTSLTEIPPLPPNWKLLADGIIDDIRKADINIEVESGNLIDLFVEVVQETSEFGFGSAVSAKFIVDSEKQSYQDFFYDNFEWATIENKLKWKQTEREQGVLSYDYGVQAVDALTANGIKVRGHTVFWGVPGKDPDWVQQLRGDALIQATKRRISDVTGRTYGKLEHWDVNNENAHGNFYEEASGNVNITMEMFKDVNAMDPKAKLFLNDFNCVNSPTYTQAYRSQAELFRDSPCVPIYGIGIQSHISPPLDLTLMKHRLDQIGEVGLPIWITELDINEADHDKKADHLEDVLRLYFSNPAVDGIILWGFWDGRHWRPDSALANGINVTANAAGLRWQQLVRQDWRTSETRSLANGNATIRGFKGDYSLKLTRHGTVIHEQPFVLGSGGANIVLTV